MTLNEDRVFGLLDPGKRVYDIDQDTQKVDREEFAAQKLFSQYLFGEKGLADTLGPTWQMVHDPRFTAIENAFIRVRKGRLGGDASVGINRQQKDGTFASGIEDLNQYSEILGEGRYFHTVLRSMAYHKAIGTLFPKRQFSVPRGEYLPGIFVFSNQLSAEEQSRVVALAATYSEFYPKRLHKQSENAVWGLIRQECPNYFSRKDIPNQVARDLFSILRLDLVGLIDDYAEVAKLQEWVLLDEEHVLVEQQHIEAEAPRVWAEIEMLERALTIRASLRATAAKVIKQIGLQRFIEDQDIKLTDFERDTLLQVVYSSNYPDDQVHLITSLTLFLTSVRNTGKTVEEREAEQCTKASGEAKAYIAKLKSGEEQPITRSTNPGEVIEEDLEGLSEEDQEAVKVAMEIQRNPLKQFVFMRLTNAEKRLAAVENRITVIGESRERYDYYTIHPAEIPVYDPDFVLLDPEQIDAAEAELPGLRATSDKLTKVIGLLAPVFERSDFVLTEESVAELMGKAEEFDSTALPIVAHPDDVAAESDQPQEAAPASEAPVV